MTTLYFFQGDDPLNVFRLVVTFLMNTLEHTFPLPEIEAHKLDAVVEEIQDPVAAQDRLPAFILNNRWLLLGLAAVAGGLLGLSLRNSRRKKKY